MDQMLKLEIRWSKRTRQSLVPDSRRLFEAINGFHQLETVELAVDLDTFGDRAEDLFLHHAIRERRHHVELIERPAEILRKSDNHAQRDVLDDRRKLSV